MQSAQSANAHMQAGLEDVLQGKEDLLAAMNEELTTVRVSSMLRAYTVACTTA